MGVAGFTGLMTWLCRCSWLLATWTLPLVLLRGCGLAVRCSRGGVSVGWVPESTRSRVGCLEGHAAWLGGYEAHLLRAVQKS